VIKEGRKEGRKEGKKKVRKEGRKELRKEGRRKESIKKGRKERRKEGRKELRKQERKEGTMLDDTFFSFMQYQPAVRLYQVALVGNGLSQLLTTLLQWTASFFSRRLLHGVYSSQS